MITKSFQAVSRTVLIAGSVGLLVLIMLPPSPMQAMLPPRYTPTPARSSHTDSDKPIGAHIELHVQPISLGLWTVVQWQDSTGAWHNVEGWQGTLDEGHKKSWWVAKADFGKGPFRWVTYQSQGGLLLATSESFFLPNQANEIMHVEVLLQR